MWQVVVESLYLLCYVKLILLLTTFIYISPIGRNHIRNLSNIRVAKTLATRGFGYPNIA